MASSRERQRKLARAKMERQMARRAARARRTRQFYAGAVVGLAVILVLVGSLWAGGVFSSTKHPAKPAAASECTWKPADTSANKDLKDVGRPPTNGLPRAGTATMTITTNLGVITASLDLAKAPCTGASFKYLAGKQFFTNSTCHRLLTSATDHVLQCGDPSGTGSGGPGYTFADEYRPAPAPAPSASAGASASASTAASGTAVYPAGSIAMANTGQPVSNGSQFFIVYEDSTFPPNYTLFGKITSGLDIVRQVGAAGDDGAFASGAGGGHPKKKVTIQSLTVGDPHQTPASPSPTAKASASGSSAHPSASANPAP